jgi:hypothetical protein
MVDFIKAGKSLGDGMNHMVHTNGTSFAQIRMNAYAYFK